MLEPSRTFGDGRMANMHNRKLILSKLPEPGLMGGIVPVAPVNQLSMVHDYIDPGERLVACPNQDVVYGFGLFSLDQEPVVVQVPDFGDRFWVYQVVDQRTDSFVQLGKMYGTKPGFYLLAGPDWKGTVPNGITGVFRSKTNLGAVIPRVFMDDTAADRQAVQPLLKGILMYPLSKFTGQGRQRTGRRFPASPTPLQVRKKPNGCSLRAFLMNSERSLKKSRPSPARRLSMPTYKVSSMRPRRPRNSMELWSPPLSMPTRISSRHSFSSTIVAFRCPTTGLRSITAQRSAPTITAERLWPNPISSLTQSARPSTFIRMPTVLDSN